MHTAILCVLNANNKPIMIARQGRPDHGAYSAAQPFVNNLPSLTISLPGQQRTMSMQEASQLSLQQFAALYTVGCCAADAIVSDSCLPGQCQGDQKHSA